MNTLPTCLEIEIVPGPIEGIIRPPGSKSITNRALLISALASGQTQLSGVLNSDDTQVMIQALRKLGVKIESIQLSGSKSDQRPTLLIQGCNGQFPIHQADLNCENSGTSIRFLGASLAAAGGRYRLDGVARMRQRPIGPLVEALHSLGANIAALSPNQCPPIEIDNDRLEGGMVTIDGSLSSQYASGLFIAAPLMKKGLEVTINGKIVSKPYLWMTQQVMEAFGVQSDSDPEMHSIRVPGGQFYRGTDYEIEPDASAASYYWAAAAICGGKATVEGLNEKSLQGDIGFVTALEMMGCQVVYRPDSISVIGPAKQGVNLDMSQISDTVQTLAAVALFVEGSTNIRNVAHNRIKETDRISDLATELRKLGAKVVEHPEGLTISNVNPRGATIETYQDHRMAMSLSLAGLKIPNVVITNPSCVTKTYPGFFEDMRRFIQGC